MHFVLIIWTALMTISAQDVNISPRQKILISETFIEMIPNILIESVSVISKTPYYFLIVKVKDIGQDKSIYYGTSTNSLDVISNRFPLVSSSNMNDIINLLENDLILITEISKKLPANESSIPQYQFRKALPKKTNQLSAIQFAKMIEALSFNQRKEQIDRLKKEEKNFYFQALSETIQLEYLIGIKSNQRLADSIHLISPSVLQQLFSKLDNTRTKEILQRLPPYLQIKYISFIDQNLHTVVVPSLSIEAQEDYFETLPSAFKLNYFFYLDEPTMMSFFETFTIEEQLNYFKQFLSKEYFTLINRISPNVLLDLFPLLSFSEKRSLASKLDGNPLFYILKGLPEAEQFSWMKYASPNAVKEYDARISEEVKKRFYAQLEPTERLRLAAVLPQRF